MKKSILILFLFGFNTPKGGRPSDTNSTNPLSGHERLVSIPRRVEGLPILHDWGLCLSVQHWVSIPRRVEGLLLHKLQQRIAELEGLGFNTPKGGRPSITSNRSQRYRNISNASFNTPKGGRPSDTMMEALINALISLWFQYPEGWKAFRYTS